MQPFNRDVPHNRFDFLLLVTSAWLVHVGFSAGIIVFAELPPQINAALVTALAMWSLVLACCAAYALHGRLQYWRFVMFAVCCLPTLLGLLSVAGFIVGGHVLSDYSEIVAAIQG